MEQAKALWLLKQSQVAALRVRAGLGGVLQLLPVQVGQRLAPGSTLAKVAEPSRLKAELKISETQAKDLQLGQPVAIDTRNGVVQGKVIRIDPAVVNGTVTVDAGLEGALPKGARPDLSVEGIIELDRAQDDLFVGRPVQAQSFGSMGLYRLSPDGAEALRVKVRLGRGSVSTIEIQEGAVEPGARVVVLDDLLATGGTLAASIKLLRKIGAHVTGAASIIELNFLPGRERLKELDVPFTSLAAYDE